MLPPGLENRNSHKYGQLIIRAKAINIQTASIESIEVSLLGMRSVQRRLITIDESAEFIFSIGTNLWHFYAYLNDARVVNIRLIDNKCKSYACETYFNLTPTHQVLSKNPNNISKNFKQNSYLQDSVNICQVFDSRYCKVGSATIQLDLSFDEALNRTLLQANLINFEDILVIDEISPISSKIDLNSVTAQIQQIIPIPISSIKQPIKASSVPESLRHLQEQLKILPKNSVPAPVNIEQLDDPTIIEQEKKIEDDIDRLIAQMQNRPYDSSKYMQQANQPLKKQNFNFTNLSLASSKSQSNQKRSDRMPSSQKLEFRLPPMMKTVNNRSDFSVSPHSKLVHTTSQNLIGHSPIKPMNKTQQIIQNQSNYPQIDKKSGLIKLKVHEFTMSRMERELSLMLKIYLNEDSEQFYTTNGMRQGETILFNSNIKINQKREIINIKFVLIDTYDMKTIFAQGLFEMNRLFSLSPSKGIFMVSLLSPMPIISTQPKILRTEQQSLVRVTPNLKNLRIQLEYEQSIQIIQIFLGLSEFSSACRKIRYKIPFTKESIQFNVSELNNSKHINIFPHNRNSSNKTNDKIIIQLWGESELIGFNEVSLKQISNTNQYIINCSLQPIFLYDQIKQVKDLKLGKNKASFWLKLFYGNISQVQNILNRDDRERKPEKQKTPVEVEYHLGIYIKQNKVKKQVEIQVDEVEMSQTWKGSQKNILSLQQQELPDDDDQDIEIEAQDQKLLVSENQFISKSMEQKYQYKQTLPIVTKSKQTSNIQSKISQFSKTIKQKPLKSLTKQFQYQIKHALIDFATEQVLSSFKHQCNYHLLFHFIQVKILINIMKKMGIHQKKIDFLLKDVILVSNDMINVNIIYDMILGLMLEGEVKEKFIDDSQIGRYSLMTLYKNLKQDEEEQQFLFDDSTQFDESRKIFQRTEYKLTMREFNLIHTYIKRQKQNHNLNDKMIRQELIDKHVKDIKQNQIKQVKQQYIISKLYKQQWEQDDEFFIRNINQNVMEQQISHSMNKNEVSLRSKQNQNDNTCSFHGTVTKQSQKLQESLFNPIQYNKIQVSKRSQELQDSFEPLTLRQPPNFKLIIQGFQSSCIETIQCLLNTALNVPRLRVVCLSEQDQKQFWVIKTSQIDKYQIQLYTIEEFVDGSIEFYDNDLCIARCNMSIMANMKSCYTLKNVETFEYCGILNLLLTHL